MEQERNGQFRSEAVQHPFSVRSFPILLNGRPLNELFMGSVLQHMYMYMYRHACMQDGITVQLECIHVL